MDHPKDAAEFELMPVPDKIIHVPFVEVDSWRHRVYKDERRRLWNYMELMRGILVKVTVLKSY